MVARVFDNRNIFTKKFKFFRKKKKQIIMASAKTSCVFAAYLFTNYNNIIIKQTTNQIIRCTLYKQSQHIITFLV